VKESLAASYTLVLHAALWLPITLLGFYYLYQQGLGWRDFRKAQEIAKEETTSTVEGVI